jgi:dolichol kinase
MKDKQPLKSKKFIAMLTGVVATTVLSFAAMGLIAHDPASASSVVNLVTVALASLNGCISLYALGQSAVDWKINSNHEEIRS